MGFSVAESSKGNVIDLVSADPVASADTSPTPPKSSKNEAMAASPALTPTRLSRDTEHGDFCFGRYLSWDRFKGARFPDKYGIFRGGEEWSSEDLLYGSSCIPFPEIGSFVRLEKFTLPLNFTN